jgi:hypothetical protein
MSGGFEAIRPPGRLQGLRTWWTMLKISLEERLVYRGDFVLGTLMRFLPIVTQVFLWTAVFSATSRGDIAGYSRNDIVAYYLLTMLTRAFSSMPGLATGIARSVRDGSVKKFLIQPVDYVSFLLAARVAHKLVYYAVAVVPFGAVFLLCRLTPRRSRPSSSRSRSRSCSASSWKPRSACSASGSWRCRASCSATCSCSTCSQDTCFRSTCSPECPPGWQA